MTGLISIATEDYVRKWFFCIESHIKYAARYGLEYRLHSDTVDGLHPKWGKFVLTIEMLRNHKAVMLIDADAEITEIAEDFNGLLDDYPNHDLLYVKGASDRINSGVMIMRGGTSSVAIPIMQYCLDNRKTPVPAEDFVTAEGENGHLINAIKQPQFCNKVNQIDIKWNCTVLDAYEDAYIRHYTNQLGREYHEGSLFKKPVGWKRIRMKIRNIFQ